MAVDSQPGEFTAFRVTLPRTLTISAARSSTADLPKLRRSSDRVNGQ